MNAETIGEITEQTWSITGDNPFAAYVSPNRNFMAASHKQQAIEILNPEQKIIQSGLEREMGRNTFSVEIERDCEVLKVIERCEARDNRNDIVELIVIVKDDLGFIDYYKIPYYFALHKKFGFKYETDPDFLRSLRYGDRLEKGTILADTASVKDGNLCLGLNPNVALLSMQGVAEDAIIISRSYAEKLAFRIFKSTRINFGSESFPLNMYGDEENYIPFPSIGSLVREDGILCALRRYSDDDIFHNTSNRDLMLHDKELDMRYVVPSGGIVTDGDGVEHVTGKVVDIEVFYNNAKTKTKQDLYPHTLGEINRHVNNTETFYKQIADFYETLAKSKDARLRYNGKMSNPVKLSERFWNLVYKSLVIINKDGSKGSQKIPLTYKAVEQDVYVCNIVTEHIIKAGIGYKLTDAYGKISVK